MNTRLKLVWVLAFMIASSACGSSQVPTIYRIDTPRYHVRTGSQMLDFRKIDSALREFDRAIDLDPRYAPAYVGKGLAFAYMGEFDKGLEALGKADRFARGKGQEVATLIGYMQFYSIGGEKYHPNWIEDVETSYNRAILIAHGYPGPHYYMGLAYKASGNLDQAAKKFYRVLEIGREYVKEADVEYAAIEKMK